MQNLKIEDHIAGVEHAGPKNAGPKHQDPKMETNSRKLIMKFN